MKLPDVFQMRVDTLPGYTHVVERLPLGRYEVKWARGWSKVRDIEWHVCTEKEAQEFVDEGGWIVVEDTKAEQGLPEKFQFYQADENILYSAEVAGESVIITWTVRGSRESATDYSVKEVEGFVKRGVWKVVQENSLTPEQLRSNAEFREQIAALDHNVKLRKQDVEHAEILIANYEARIKDLESKLVKES